MPEPIACILVDLIIITRILINDKNSGEIEYGLLILKQFALYPFSGYCFPPKPSMGRSLLLFLRMVIQP
ncbi:hypothetical protein EPH91_22630 [Shigella flexneri]|nr:hypothetical protein [Shigella flexneri]